MSRDVVMLTSSGVHVPRASGDEPEGGGENAASKACSPRERG